MSSDDLRQSGKCLPQPDLEDIRIDQVMRALGEPARLRIVRSLARSTEPMSCGAFDLPLSKSTTTHHFKVLRESGVILQYREGTCRYSLLRHAELERRFPGLLAAVLRADEPETAEDPDGAAQAASS
ncbi:ArsR/SmtB family transcription factor [Sphaerimonospora cavernae]|uniref:ArsR/SmtB family transcription factor n=1 Tax=Sphaerimonospora cavernae TaxID=1740611 RepID=A0ABV6U8P5_9ACTN